MKHTLRAARKIDTKILQQVQNLDITPTTSISVYHEDPRDIHSAKRETFIKDVENVMKLIDIRYKIRHDIQRANSAANINQLTGRRKQVQDKIRFLEDYLQLDRMYRSFEDESVLWSKLDALKIASGDTTSSRSDNVTFPLLVDLDIEVYKKLIRSFETVIEGYDEELLSVNASTKIEIADEDLEFLKQFDIV